MPEPQSSPAWIVSLWETCAIRSGNENWRPLECRPDLAVDAGDHPQVVDVDLIRGDEVGADGVAGVEVFPLLGPMPTGASRICWSRALKSFQMV